MLLDAYSCIVKAFSQTLNRRKILLSEGMRRPRLLQALCI